MRAPDVLIIEDDEPTQSFLRIVCKHLGYAPMIMGEGDEAIAELEKNQEWRVLLLDLYLPKRNGFQLIEDLRSRAPQLLSRTIVMTAGGERDIQRVRDLGLVHCVMRKPLDINELNQRMATCASMPSRVAVRLH